MVPTLDKHPKVHPRRDAEAALAALKRAALRAREEAKGTSGYVVYAKNGQIIKEPVE